MNFRERYNFIFLERYINLYLTKNISFSEVETWHVEVVIGQDELGRVGSDQVG